MYNKENSFNWLEKEHKEEYFTLSNFKTFNIGNQYEKLEEDYFQQGEFLRKYALHLSKENSFQFSSKTIKEVAFKIQELVEEFVIQIPEIRKEFEFAEKITNKFYNDYDDYDYDDYCFAESCFREKSRNLQKLLIAQVVEYFHNRF